MPHHITHHSHPKHELPGRAENTAEPGFYPNVYTNYAEALDSVGSAFYEAGLPGSEQGTGMPTDRNVSAEVAAGTLNFHLAGYDGNNALQIAPVVEDHFLDLVQPGKYTHFAFLGFSTEALTSDAIGDITVYFDDNSSTLFENSLNFPDWYLGSGTQDFPTVFVSEGRVSTFTGEFNNDLMPGLEPEDGGKLFAATIQLSPADSQKTVTGFNFHITSSDPDDRTYILAVAAIPEPSTVLLLLLAGMGALFCRKNRRNL